MVIESVCCSVLPGSMLNSHFSAERKCHLTQRVTSKKVYLVYVSPRGVSSVSMNSVNKCTQNGASAQEEKGKDNDL